MMLKKKILSWWWSLRYKDYDVLWFDNLVDIETGERGIKLYHIVDSICEKSRPMDMLGIKTVTRAEAESMDYCPCELCFKKVLPK